MRHISGYDLPWQDDEVRLPWWRRALNWLDTVSFAYRNDDGPGTGPQPSPTIPLDKFVPDNYYRYHDRTGWGN